MPSLRSRNRSRTASAGIKFLAVIVLFNTAVLIWVVLKLTGAQPVNVSAVVPPKDAPTEVSTPVAAQKPIQLPGSFAEVAKGDAELARRAAELDEKLAGLNKLIEDNARVNSGAKTSQPSVVPENLQPSLEALQKWVRDGRKGPSPAIPLPKTDGLSPSWTERNRELIRAAAIVAAIAICIARPELTPLVLMLASALEFASPESLADVVKTLEGIQGAVQGKQFTLEQIRAMKSVSSKLLKVSPTRVDKYVDGFSKALFPKSPEERTAAIEDLVVSAPNSKSKDEYELSFKKLLQRDTVEVKDFDPLLARLERDAEGKHRISSGRLEQLRRTFDSPAEAKVLAEVEKKLSVIR